MEDENFLIHHSSFRVAFDSPARITLKSCPLLTGSGRNVAHPIGSTIPLALILIP
jgi:hypothetical protein